MKSKYKPSAYFPFFGNEFFQAVKGYPDTIAMSYLHALWHYWHHCHCEGLPDQDDYLMRVCNCLISDWVRTKGILFDNDKFFRLDGGKWHQGRAVEEHQRSVEIYRTRVKSIANARKHNPIHSPEINPDTSIEINPLKSTLDSGCIYPNPKTVSNKQTNNGHPELKEVLDYASMTGILESDARDFWHHFESSGWIDKNGHAIVSWRSKIQTWKTVERAGRHKANMPVTKASDVVAGILKGVA